MTDRPTTPQDMTYRRTFDLVCEVEAQAEKDGDWETAFLRICQHANTLNAELRRAQSETGCKSCEEKQAQIDRLMLEYCPDEMTLAQIDNWQQHQRPATDEEAQT